MTSDLEFTLIENRLYQLPEELKELLLSEETARKIDSLSEKHQISRESWDAVLEETGKVMMGLTLIEQLKDRLAARTRLPVSRMLALAAEIDRDILAPYHTQIEAMATGSSVPRNSRPADEIPHQSLGDTPSLADRIAQFQARKKQKEEELVKQGTATSAAVTPSAQPDPYREPIA